MKEIVAIATNFMEFNPGNSLTGIVLDQIEMLSSHGHEVYLVVNEQYHGEESRAKLHKILPFFHLRDYRRSSELTEEHQQIALKTASVLKDFISSNKVDIVITHDLMFQGWFMPYCFGIKKASLSLPKTRWFHWVHSIPSQNWDWHCISILRPNHKIIYPNGTDLHHVASQYRGVYDDVRCIHHIKDHRSWMEFSEATNKFISAHPAVMRADVVQLLPASCDRLGAKRLSETLQIFGNIKAQGLSVCLVVANQWATVLTRKEDVNRYKWEAKCRGLVPGEDFIFTSDFDPPKYEIGIPKRMIRELFSLSNLFVFLTREETFGLVIPEACMSGGVLLVLNKSLEMLSEVSGANALFFEFGSFNRQYHNSMGDKYYTVIARDIVSKMLNDTSIRAKSFIRQRYNWDYLYDNEYRPLFDESREWIK